MSYADAASSGKRYVSQLPCGISKLDIRHVFSFYGNILEVQPVMKTFYGTQLDTLDRIVIFEKIDKPIPSYVFVRGWRAFVLYKGQVQTCRICGVGGHIAKDCPTTKLAENPAAN